MESRKYSPAHHSPANSGLCSSTSSLAPLNNYRDNPAENRLVKCLTLRLALSTWLVQIRPRRGLPAFTLSLTPTNGAGEYRLLASTGPGVSASRNTLNNHLFAWRKTHEGDR